MGTIQIRKGGTIVSWLFLNHSEPCLREAFRAGEGTSRAVVDLVAGWDVMFDSAGIARAMAAACTEAAEALDRLAAEGA